MAKIKVSNFLSTNRIEDENGFIFVKKSPILKAGILEYLGSELGGTDEGLESEKFYKVNLSLEELKKGADSFKLLPIVNGHEWLGSDGANAKDFQEGSLGENWEIENEMLYFPLLFTGDNAINDLQSGIEELSASYNIVLKPSKTNDYDFEATEVKGNHVALVEQGRCGEKVKVLNSKQGEQMSKKKRAFNEDVKLTIGDTEISLIDKSVDEAVETIGIDNEDKREVIREIMAIAGKSNDEFDGGEDEKVETIAKLAERLGYESSEDSSVDNEDEEEVIENAECENEEDEETPVDNEDDSDEDKMAKMENSILKKVQNANAKAEAEKMNAYNEVSNVIGEFNPFGLSSRDMYVRALNHCGVESTGKETIGELKIALRTFNAVSKTRVDNSFKYSSNGANDTIEIKF